MTDSATWHGISLAEHIRSIGGQLVRIVESQEQIATTAIVDTLEEQALLEDLIEKTKPPIPPSAENLHYLLLTPFRYPPLRHGSRFGRHHEPSILYGSHQSATALCEAAYYRLLFWSGMETPPTRPIRSQHTLFAASYQTNQGMQLQHAPFDNHRSQLTSPVDYSATQALGTAMRNAGVLGFEFHSARDPLGGINVGLFEPSALPSPEISSQEEWLCEVDHTGARFLNLSKHTTHSFPINTFLINNNLPHPAQ